MELSQLAKKLMAARDDAARRRLLKKHTGDGFRELAEQVRLICFDAWATEPVTARRAAEVLRTIDRIAGDPYVTAVSRWVEGIADVTRGRFGPAVNALKKAIDKWSSIGMSGEMAQTRVSLLLALAMQGRYDEAIESGISALKTFVKLNDQLAAGKIEMNLSNIVSRRGLHRDAERYCASALRRFIKADEPQWQAMAENGLANTYAELDQFDEAESYYRQALDTASKAGMLVTEAEIEASMGNLALFRGRYADALRWLEESRRKYERLGMPHQSAIAELEIADIYSELNLNGEALEIYEKVTAEFRELRMRAEEARARLNRSRTAAAAGDLRLAGKEARRALALYRAELNLAGEGAARMIGARVALGNRRYGTAVRAALDAADLLRHARNTRHELTARLVAGSALMLSGKGEQARPLFNAVRRRAAKLGLPELEQQALTSLGDLAISNGSRKLAERNFQRAAEIVERLRAPLASEEFSISYMAARLAPYDSLTRLYIDSGRIEEAFATVESRRSRALLDSIGNRPADGADKRLSLRVASLRDELNHYYKRLERTDAEGAEALRAEISQRERALADLSKRIASTTMRGRANRKPALRTDAASLARSLGRDRTLIEYVEIDGGLSAFVVAKGEISLFRDIAAAADVFAELEELQFQFGSLRFGTPGIERFRAQLKVKADLSLGRLYKLLIAPLEERLAGSSLVIVPAGVLHYVPFPALFDGEHYLAERFELAHAPSASVWSMLRMRRGRRVKSSLLIGFADEAAPEVESEVRELERKVPAPVALTGENATFSAFAANASKHGLIHLACHGRFRAESPMFSSLHLADGWVTVRDICDQRIDAELVTLSACETGLSSVHAGDEILGLSRAFLTAGAAGLIVSLWTVNDAATRSLMSMLYDGIQRGEHPSASLRTAQIAAIKEGGHPMLWAPFVFIGR